MGSRSGFSLLELVITIALIVLLSSIFVWNIDSVLRKGEIEQLENEFWDALTEAKQRAVFEGQPYALSWDGESRSFWLVSGEARKQFEVDTEAFGESVEIGVAFREMFAENGYKLIGGRLVVDREIEKVFFYPDGTCTPFTVDLTIAGYATEIKIDPWTGARLAPREESG